MPSTIRQWARQELERAAANIEWIGQHVNRVEEVYRPEHPEIADPCLLVLQTAAELQKLIIDIRAKI